jgi:cyclophilin family peptidyl-prolyl cis-trans isomerase/PKD repeat protein
LRLIPEIVLNSAAQPTFKHALNNQRWITVLLGIAAFLFAACSSPAVAEFSTTSDAGNAPFEVSFTLGETVDGDTFSWDFGDGAGSTESEPSHTFQDAGIFTVRLTVQKGDSVAVADTEITVEAGIAGWVVIEGGASSVSSLNSTKFTASAFDVLGNPIKNPEFRWNVDPAAGEIDDSGAFTAGTDLNTFENGVTVEFERLGVVVTQSTSIEVTTGPLHAFSIKPEELDIQVGRSETIQVEAVDEAGHVLDSALVLFTSLRTGDNVYSTGRFTAHTVASEQISDLVEVEVELDGQVIKAMVPGIIRPGILDEVHVSSLPPSLEVGKSYQLESFATDRFGNELELDELRWSVTDPGIGSITKSGFFTVGTTAGQHIEDGIVVRGILNEVESFTIAPVTISAGVVETIHIVPKSDSVPIGAGSPFAVLALDAHGNLLDIDNDQFLYEYSSAGRGDEIAMFIAGYELGDFENAITVRLPAGTAGNEVELVAQSDISIRQRSSNMIAVELLDEEGGTIVLIDLETGDRSAPEESFQGNGAVEIAPAWWPDGSRLVYVSDLTGDLQVYSLDLGTKKIIQLTNVAGGASMPSISPDGQSIAFVSLDAGDLQLYIAEIPDDVELNPIALESAVRLSEQEGEQQVLPYWSPDGTMILVSQNTINGRVRVVIFDPTLVDPPRPLGPSGSVGFGWTADGSGIHVGLATANNSLELGTLDLSELEPVFVGANFEFVSAAWSPDDSELAAVDGLLGAGWIFDSDGTGFRRVIGTDQAPERMAWRPIEYGDPVQVPELPDASEPTMLSIGDDPRRPVGALDTSLTYSAVISTDSGDIKVDLCDDLAPMTVENFINLARIGFYDGLEFYRVVEGFISQAGDPLGDGTGGPGYLFNDELTRELSHDSTGVLSMANSGSNTNGSQFFIAHEPSKSLDAYENDVAKNCASDAVACHSVFGQVTGGLEIVTAMVERDPEAATAPGVKILGITIIER